MIIKVQCHYPDMPTPAKAHPSDAAFDLTAMAVETLRPGVYAFDTGISIQCEPGYYAEVAPRSSIVKTDFMLANSIGVIDPDYRGRIRVVLRYLGDDADRGEAQANRMLSDRIAQLLVRKVEPARMERVENLEDTRRGEGGFGSTGK